MPTVTSSSSDDLARQSPFGPGRIKPPPICQAESLMKEALSSDELSKICFTPQEACSILSQHPLEMPVSLALSKDSNVNSDAIETRLDGNPETWKSRGIVSSHKSSVQSKRMSSRTGRENQRWATDPHTNQLFRLVTGTVPIMSDGRILFCSSSRKLEWILPKGGWEMDETMEESALRETFEEAGVSGTLGTSLVENEYETRKAKKRRMEREEMMKKVKQVAERRTREVLASMSSGQRTSMPPPQPSSAVVSVHSHSSGWASSEDEHHSFPISTGTSEVGGMDKGVTHFPVSSVMDLSSQEGVISPDGQADGAGPTAAIFPPHVPVIDVAPPFDDTASIASVASCASDTSTTCTHVRMTLFPLYVSEVRDEWPESGRARKVLDIDGAIQMMEHRPEFQKALLEVKQRGLHLTSSRKMTTFESDEKIRTRSNENQNDSPANVVI